MKPDFFKIGNKVKLARVEKDLTQTQLAEAVGVTRQTIGLIEAGRYNPTLKLCLLIARALGKTLDQLFWVEEGKDEKENDR
ncbi:MAG: helix-turn-helix transcriptional regulator [Bacillota bacterium]|nr:helix-turn-helix transcriptional regulator [Thermoanaerobacteraceae bacterium]